MTIGNSCNSILRQLWYSPDPVKIINYHDVKKIFKERFPKYRIYRKYLKDVVDKLTNAGSVKQWKEKDSNTGRQNNVNFFCG